MHVARLPVVSASEYPPSTSSSSKFSFQAPQDPISIKASIRTLNSLQAASNPTPTPKPKQRTTGQLQLRSECKVKPRPKKTVVRSQYKTGK